MSTAQPLGYSWGEYTLYNKKNTNVFCQFLFALTFKYKVHAGGPTKYYYCPDTVRKSKKFEYKNCSIHILFS